VTSSARPVTLALAVMVAGCAMTRPAPSPPPAAHAPGPVRLYALDDKAVALGHAAATQGGDGAVVSAGQPVGGFERPPAVLSTRHQGRMDSANALYDTRDYAGALAAIEPAYLDERDNPFVIETYARVLYRMGERAQSFVVYRQLVDLLDARWRASAVDSVTVDLWFVDAYWKAGTLHMDRREWERAAFEISRALVGGLAWEPLAEDQALSYLTRAFFELGRHEEARYYAERALGRNPRNTYARQYLDRLARQPKERSRWHD
jgi:tetratricopeptide (TPR) repeat protein